MKQGRFHQSESLGRWFFEYGSLQAAIVMALGPCPSAEVVEERQPNLRTDETGTMMRLWSERRAENKGLTWGADLNQDPDNGISGRLAVVLNQTVGVNVTLIQELASSPDGNIIVEKPPVTHGYEWALTFNFANTMELAMFLAVFSKQMAECLPGTGMNHGFYESKYSAMKRRIPMKLNFEEALLCATVLAKIYPSLTGR